MISNIVPPSLFQLLKNLGRNISVDLNCAKVGHIVSFDPAKVKASVQIDMKQVTVVPDGEGGEKEVYFDYPLLTEVPVMVWTGGAALITMPIQVGDQCLVIFNDRDLSAWATGQITLPPPSARIHDFTDAVCLVGLHNTLKPITDYSTTDIQLRGIGGGLVSVVDTVKAKGNAGGQVFINDKVTSTGSGGATEVVDDKVTSTGNGGGKVTIDDKVTALGNSGGKVVCDAKVGITNSGGSLLSALNSLCDALTAWVDTHGDTPNPGTIAAINAAKSSIGDILQ